MSRHFYGVFEKIIYTSQFHEGKKEKSLVCKEEEVEIFIDDYLENILSVSKLGVKCFLMDNPWNQGEVPENVKRVKGWEEIVEEIDKKLNK